MFARVAEAQRLVRLLTDGTSVEVVGARWSGRTTLLMRVRQTLKDTGHTIVTVRGVGDEIPLEAVRVALPPRARKAISDAGGRAGSIVDALAELFSEGAGVIVVDDADNLDHESWFVLETVHKSLGIPILSAALRRPVTNGARHSLVAVAHPVVRISLGELGLEEIHDILGERVGGSISPRASGRIHTRSAGQPGFAVAILDAALADGRVRKDGTVWIADADLWSDDLNGAYESLLCTYEGDVREAVEILSLAGTVEFDTAQALIGQPRLEVLEGHALIRIFSTGQRLMVAITPPGLADYFHHQPLSARRTRLLEQMRGALEAHDLEDQKLQLERRQAGPIDSSAEPYAPTTKEHAPLIVRMFSEDYSIRLAAAGRVWAAHPSIRNAADYLYLQLSGTQDPEVIESILSATDHRRPHTDVDELEFAVLESRWLASQGASAIDAVRPLVSDANHDLAEILDTIAILTRIELDGIAPEFEQLLSDRAGGTGLGADVAAIAFATQLTIDGQGERALKALNRIGEDAPLLLSRAAEIIRGLALFAAGRFAASAAHAQAGLSAAIDALDRESLMGHSYVAVLALGTLGRFDEATELAALVMSAQISAAPLFFAPDRALMLSMSIIASRSGRTLAAESLLEHALQIGGNSSALPLGDPDWVNASAAGIDGDGKTAAELFSRLSRRLYGSRYELASAGAGMLSMLSSFDEFAAAEFRPRADKVGGALYGARLDAKLADRAGDPLRLQAAARIIRDEGATADAVRYYNRAAQLFREQRDEDRAHTARSMVHQLLATTGNAVTAASLMPSVRFTSREAEIMQLIAAGKPNGEIAASLFISVRTVESHINNIRRKTGAVDRSDISDFIAK